MRLMFSGHSILLEVGKALMVGQTEDPAVEITILTPLPYLCPEECPDVLQCMCKKIQNEDLKL